MVPFLFSQHIDPAKHAVHIIRIVAEDQLKPLKRVGEMDTATSPSPGQADQGVPSDAELLKRAFITRDPERLSSVSKTLPDNYLTAEIEFWYDLTPPKGQERDYIWCAHDGRETHWKGYVMKTEDGVRFLIGKDCGKDIFGHDFNQIARSFSVLHTRQGYLIQLGSTAAALPAAIKELRHLIAHPVLGQYQTVKARLRSEMPDIHRNLVAAVSRRGGLLVVEDRVRDYAAELRRAERQGDEDEELERAREKKERGEMTLTAFKRLRDEVHLRQKSRANDPIYTTVERTVGRVSGGDLFGFDPVPREVLQTRLDDLRTLQEELSGPTEGISTRKLQAAFRKLRECVEDVEVQLQRLRAPMEFFDKTNLATVAGWATNVPKCTGKYRSVGRTIVWEAPREDVEVMLPAGYEVPATPKLEILKLALSRSGRDAKSQN